MKRLLILCTLFIAISSLPTSAILDTNQNQLSDLWEKAFNGGNLFPPGFDLQADSDGDGWTNAEEEAAGTDPFDPNSPGGLLRPDITHIPESWADLNGDGIEEHTPEAIIIAWPTIAGKQYTLLYSPDLADWLPVPGETLVGEGSILDYHITLTGDDRIFWRVAVNDIDSDGDGLTNAEEIQLGTNPHNAQTLPGYGDLWLATNFTEMLLNGQLVDIDTDGDGLTNAQEYQLGTDPTLADSDGDGMPDGWEIKWGLNPMDPADAAMDADGDHVSNFRECQLGTSPTGIYRIEVLPTGDYPYFHSAADDGSVVVQETLIPGSQLALVPAPDASGIRTLVDPAPPSTWNDLETIIGDLVEDSTLGESDTLTPSGLVSSLGTFRVFQSNADLLILQEPGEFFGPLAAGISWQAVNNSGKVAGTIIREITASDNIPAHNERDVVIKDGTETTNISMPSEWLPATLAPVIQAFSDDGLVLIRRSVTNIDLSISNQFYLLDVATDIFSQVRLPGLGEEVIVSLSSLNGRILGNGPKPFQVTPDGTPILLENLQIQNSPSTAAIALSSVYSSTLIPNHIASDGSITLTTYDSIGQRHILQIIPNNEINKNGLPDDWESSQIAYLIAADPVQWGYLSAAGVLDPNTVYGTSQDTAAQSFAYGKNIGATQTPQVPDIPSYAVFPLNIMPPDPSIPYPLEVNDQGTVLYSSGTWANGSLRPLNGENHSPVVKVRALSMNDIGEIIGFRMGMTDTDGYLIPGNLVYWSGPSDDRHILTVDGEHPWIGRAYYQSDMVCMRGVLLSNDGRLLAESQKLDIGTTRPGSCTVEGQYLWTLPGHNRQAGKIPVFLKEGGVLDKDHYWGTTRNGGLGLQSLAESLPLGGHVLTRLHIQPKGEILATFSDLNPSAQVHINGDKSPVWESDLVYAKAIELSLNGTAIGVNHDGKNAPILLDLKNHKWIGIDRYAPGIPGDWTDSTVKLVDTTSRGWVLAQRGLPNSLSHAIMLPIKVDGLNSTATEANKLSAGGVDRLSMTADGGTGHVPEMWIMAPCNGTNTVRFQIPLKSTTDVTTSTETTSKVTISCKDVNGIIRAAFTPSELDKADIQVQVSGTENPPMPDFGATLKLGNTVESISVPLKVKVMKKRMVKVALHLVKGQDKNDNYKITSPQYMPTKKGLEDYLNMVFGSQANTFFDVTEPIVEDAADKKGILFDANGDHKIFVSSTPGPEMADAMPHCLSMGYGADMNIDVWVIGGKVSLIEPANIDHSENRSVFGVALVPYGKILVDGDLSNPNNEFMLPTDKSKYLLFVIAHEIGHVMTNDMHPQELDSHSRLEFGVNKRDTYVASRLMCDGRASNPSDPGIRLIKREWDRIEDWLKTNIDKQ